jgi:hypothetical protein
MRYYLDTEFDESRVELISVGIVDQTGRRFYAINEDYDWDLAAPWLLNNVQPRLRPDEDESCNSPDHLCSWAIFDQNLFYVEGSCSEIADHLRSWANLDQGDEGHEFWAYYGAWDWVLLRRLFRHDAPMALPLLYLDLKQLALSVGVEGPLSDLVAYVEPRHNALADAEWCRRAHEALAVAHGRLV